MDFERAQKIVNSADTYEVFYRGKLVWITGLHPNNKTADIEILSEHTHVNVPVEELVEGENLH